MKDIKVNKYRDLAFLGRRGGLGRWLWGLMVLVVLGSCSTTESDCGEGETFDESRQECVSDGSEREGEGGKLPASSSTENDESASQLITMNLGAGELKKKLKDGESFHDVVFLFSGGWQVEGGVVQTVGEFQYRQAYDHSFKVLTLCQARTGELSLSAKLTVSEKGHLRVTFPRSTFDEPGKLKIKHILGVMPYGLDEVNEKFRYIDGSTVSTQNTDGCFKYLYAAQKGIDYVVNASKGIMEDHEDHDEPEYSSYMGASLPPSSKVYPNKDPLFMEPTLEILVGAQGNEHTVATLQGGGLKYFLGQFDPSLARSLTEYVGDEIAFERAMKVLVEKAVERLD